MSPTYALVRKLTDADDMAGFDGGQPSRADASALHNIYRQPTA